MRLPLLFLHIAGGMVGLLSGTVAMVYRKGSRGHRTAGNVFVVAMLVMGLCGSTLASMKHQMNNVFGGLLTVYMITTAWLAGHRRDGETSVFDWGALVFGLTIGGSLVTLGVLVANGQAAPQAGVPLGMYFFMGTIPLLAAAGDIRMLMRGGISGTPRIARHLWRMCFGLFIATGSFFLGQQQVFPLPIRKRYILAPLAILPLVLLIYWLVRVRINKRVTGTGVSQWQVKASA
jgi:uncharacterized membrane protein